MTQFMYRIAEGIMDPAAAGALEDNLATPEAVVAYGDGLRVCLEEWGEPVPPSLTLEEAEVVRRTCRAMADRVAAGEIPGSDDWIKDYERPLKDYRACCRT